MSEKQNESTACPATCPDKTAIPLYMVVCWFALQGSEDGAKHAFHNLVLALQQWSVRILL